MTLAYTLAPGRGDTDLILHRTAQMLATHGLHSCGTVQINSDRPDDGPCDMDVCVLPDGPTLRISQSLGKASRGCRLDPNALETAVGHVQTRLTQGADVLIINKFGKHEAEGRGFRDVIATALAQGIPTLIGLNTLNAPAFHAFTEGCAIELAPDAGTLAAWVLDLHHAQAA